MHLKTFGHPVLLDGDQQPVCGMRRKDLALLVYLCVEGTAVHPRRRLASLLWGKNPEDRARHSLTQALGRLGRAAPGVLVVEKGEVRRAATLPCDAVRLTVEAAEAEGADEVLALYAAPFLEGFDPGPGTEEFQAWAERRRAELCGAAVRLVERAGAAAAAAGDWGRALRLAERAIQIDPMWEEGHRRLMRAQAASGERNRALWHYHVFQAWLAAEAGALPDPETRALAEQLSGLDALAVDAGDPGAAPADAVGERMEVRNAAPSFAPPAALRTRGWRGAAGALRLVAGALLVLLLAAAVRACGV